MKSHGFRFSLRTLFVLLSLFGCVIGWTCLQLKWMHDRHKAIYWLEGKHYEVAGQTFGNGAAFSSGKGMGLLPFGLRMFREQPIGEIYLYRWPGDRTYTVDDLEALFPEVGEIILCGPTTKAEVERTVRIDGEQY